jgi:hypothetical protein
MAAVFMGNARLAQAAGNSVVFCITDMVRLKGKLGLIISQLNCRASSSKALALACADLLGSAGG